MQKKTTRDLHIDIANKTMTYIYRNIDTPINIDELALEFDITKIHLHRLFKEQMGINIYESIKSIRLQKASNLLLTNKYSTITQIANMCGYSSQSSFIKAFKERFNQTPKQWRNGGYKTYSNKILENSLLLNTSLPDFDESKVRIVKTESRKVYYLRQKGYINEEGKKKWQQLQAWVYTNDLEEYEQIGIFHDNPAITPHEECFYIAAISPKDDKILNTNMPSNILHGGLYAAFDISGEDNEAGWFVQWAYHTWLPNSGFETTTEPSYMVMRKNHMLEENGIDATFYLPIRNT